MASELPTSHCTLDASDREARMREWQSLRAEALISESHSSGGSVSVFKAGADVKRRIEALIEAENDCCSHLRFDLTDDDGGIAVEVTSWGRRPARRPLSSSRRRPPSGSC